MANPITIDRYGSVKTLPIKDAKLRYISDPTYTSGGEFMILPEGEKTEISLDNLQVRYGVERFVIENLRYEYASIHHLAWDSGFVPIVFSTCDFRPRLQLGGGLSSSIDSEILRSGISTESTKNPDAVHAYIMEKREHMFERVAKEKGLFPHLERISNYDAGEGIESISPRPIVEEFLSKAKHRIGLDELVGYVARVTGAVLQAKGGFVDQSELTPDNWQSLLDSQARERAKRDLKFFAKDCTLINCCYDESRKYEIALASHYESQKEMPDLSQISNLRLTVQRMEEGDYGMSLKDAEIIRNGDPVEYDQTQLKASCLFHVMEMFDDCFGK